MTVIDEFSTRFKKLRDDMNMTQKEFSDYIDLSQQVVSGYERGISSPALDTLVHIAKQCNVSTDWLLGLSERKENDLQTETYADVIKLFLKVEEALGNLIDITVAEYSNVGTEYEKPLFANIFIGTNIFSVFLFEWKKMIDLLNNGTIDIDVYNLWIEKSIVQYDYEIKDKEKEYTDDE